MKPQITEGMMQHLLVHSYRNYHAKGLDYLCLQRSEHLTLKVYFFDNPAFEAGEVVCPHDHRYNFSTTVIRGSATNQLWAPLAKVQVKPSADLHFDRFRWYTPLNGGRGFQHDGVAALKLDSAIAYGPGATYMSSHATLHTLAKVQPGTILVLEQGRDLLPADAPTYTYVPMKSYTVPKPPSLTGLYDRFTPDQVLARLEQLQTASPGALVWLKEGK